MFSKHVITSGLFHNLENFHFLKLLPRILLSYFWHEPLGYAVSNYCTIRHYHNWSPFQYLVLRWSWNLWHRTCTRQVRLQSGHTCSHFIVIRRRLQLSLSKRKSVTSRVTEGIQTLFVAYFLKLLHPPRGREELLKIAQKQSIMRHDNSAQFPTQIATTHKTW